METETSKAAIEAVLADIDAAKAKVKAVEEAVDEARAYADNAESVADDALASLESAETDVIRASVKAQYAARHAARAERDINDILTTLDALETKVKALELNKAPAFGQSPIDFDWVPVNSEREANNLPANKVGVYLDTCGDDVEIMLSYPRPDGARSNESFGYFTRSSYKAKFSIYSLQGSYDGKAAILGESSPINAPQLRGYDAHNKAIEAAEATLKGDSTND